MNIWKQVGIIIRSARERILTLDAHPLPKQARVIIVASAEQYHQHRDVYTRRNVTVVRNAGDTLGSSAHACYKAARSAYWPVFFRMDDELPERFFCGLRADVLDVEYVIRQFYAAMQKLGVTLVGPASTSRQDWLQPKMVRSYAGISGAAMLCATPKWDPGRFIDPTIRHFDDIYESCSHREFAGAVGRCQYIGGNKRATTGPSQTTVRLLQRTQREAVKMITSRFADFVSVDGESTYTHNTAAGKTIWSTPHWVFKRHATFRGGSIALKPRALK